MRPVVALMCVLVTAAPAISKAQRPSGSLPEPRRQGIPPSLLGLIYKDGATGTIIYVETDARHVAAISPDGKLLWRKDPFVDANLQPYRVSRPTIVLLGPQPSGELPEGASAPVATIAYNSSQFGLINIKDGHFTFLGQN
jgi:hypothetical protein